MEMKVSITSHPQVESLKDHYGVEKAVSLPEWCRLLQENEPTEENVKRLPALGIQSVFEAAGEGMETVNWSLKRLSSLSQGTVPTISKALIEGWLASWN
jgi:hypothetical protein